MSIFSDIFLCSLRAVATAQYSYSLYICKLSLDVLDHWICDWSKPYVLWIGTILVNVYMHASNTCIEENTPIHVHNEISPLNCFADISDESSQGLMCLASNNGTTQVLDMKTVNKNELDAGAECMREIPSLFSCTLKYIPCVIYLLNPLLNYSHIPLLSATFIRVQCFPACSTRPHQTQESTWALRPDLNLIKNPEHPVTLINWMIQNQTLILGLAAKLNLIVRTVLTLLRWKTYQLHSTDTRDSFHKDLFIENSFLISVIQNQETVV